MHHKKDGSFDKLSGFLSSVRKACIKKSSLLAFNDKDFANGYTICLYSIVIELAGDCCHAVKARKERASYVLTRALLEAVVDLFNVIKNPKYVHTRFQRALVERKKKLTYLQEKEPGLISRGGRDVNYVDAAIRKIDNLRDTHIEQPNIRNRFRDADMEGYYDTAYSLLCDFCHLDASTLLSRPVGLKVSPLDDISLLMLSDLIAELLLDSTIAIHEMLGSKKSKEIEELKSRWKAVYSQQAATIGPR